VDIFAELPELRELYSGSSLVGRTGKRFEQAGSASTLNNLAAIKAFLESDRPRNTLEIGLAFGASCLLIAHHHGKTGVSDARHIAIDPFQDTVWDGVARRKLDDAGLSSWVTILPKVSSLVLPQLVSEGIRMDLIYVDGSHLFEDVFIDVFYSWKLLGEGGLLLMDDSSDPHIHKVIMFVRKNLACGLREVEIPTVSAGKRLVQKLMRRQQLTAFRKTVVSDRSWNAAFVDF